MAKPCLKRNGISRGQINLLANKSLPKLHRNTALLILALVQDICHLYIDIRLPFQGMILELN